ncbi:MAG: hypothetical protein VX672_10380, partial [Planctomycetota bacterium]|nr:hypothetical protein [Planctomycetota bacterium]
MPGRFTTVHRRGSSPGLTAIWLALSSAIASAASPGPSGQSGPKGEDATPPTREAAPSEPESSSSAVEEMVDAGPSPQERFDQAKSELDRLIATPGADESWLRSQRNLVDPLDASLRALRKLQAFESDVRGAVDERAAAEARLKAAGEAKERPVDLPLGLAEARQRLLVIDGTVADLSRELANLEGTVDRRDVRREQVRTEAADFKDWMATLDGATDDSVELRGPKRQRIRLETRALEAEIRAYHTTAESLRIGEKSVLTDLRIARSERDTWKTRVDRGEDPEDGPAAS